MSNTIYIPEPYNTQLRNAQSLREIDSIHKVAKKAYPNLFYTDEEELELSKKPYIRQAKTVFN